jgi:hypothetical protein
LQSRRYQGTLISLEIIAAIAYVFIAGRNY